MKYVKQLTYHIARVLKIDHNKCNILVANETGAAMIINYDEETYNENSSLLYAGNLIRLYAFEVKNLYNMNVYYDLGMVRREFIKLPVY